MGILDTLTDALGDDERGASRYRCRDCDRTFTYRAELDEPDCPYCDSRLVAAPERR